MSETKPYFQAHLFMCTNKRPPGHPHGPGCGVVAEGLRDHMYVRARQLGFEASVRLNTASCLGRCGLGPLVVIYPEGIWYTCQNTADVDAIMDSHLLRGERVERLMLTPDQETLTAAQRG